MQGDKQVSSAPERDHRARALAAFRRALDGEAHVLGRHPELLWQQLYNRLQWQVQAAELGALADSINGELRSRSTESANPWLLQLKRLVESEPLVRTLSGHSSEVNACAFGPKGRQIASGGSDGDVRLWEAKTGETMLLGRHHGRVTACAFSPSGRHVAAGSTDGRLILWGVGGEQTIESRSASLAPIYCCVFHPTRDKTVVTGHSDGKVRFWEADAGTMQASTILGAHRSEVLACAFHPAGDALVSGAADGSLRLYQLSTGQQIAVLEEGSGGAIHCCDFSPDGKLVITGDSEAALRTWDVQTRHLLSALTAPRNDDNRDEVLACAFDRTGDLIVSGHLDGRVRLWEVGSGRVLTVLRGHANWVNSCSLDPSAQTVVSAGADETLKLWNVATLPRGMASLESHDTTVTDCAFSPDGRTLASVSMDETIKI